MTLSANPMLSAFPRFVERLPSAKDVVGLTSRQLDAILLQCVVEVTQSEDPLQSKFVSEGILSNLYPFSGTDNAIADQRIMESWSRLKSSNLIMQAPRQSQGAMQATQQGCEVTQTGRIEEIMTRQLLRPEMLHPSLPASVYENFAAGDYDNAVREAFVHVEAAVRTAAGLPHSVYGGVLIEKAFQPGTGPLANKELPEREQEQIVQLFIGALGTFKNPLSHRVVGKYDPLPVIEELLLASRLLRFIP